MKIRITLLLAVFALIGLGRTQAQTCNAAFQYTLGQCPTVYYFDGSTVGPGDFILSWAWDFGDGNTSAVQNPQHTYTANGNYVVTLTIFTALFCTDTITDTIPVTCITPPGCQAGFQYTLAQCPSVQFIDGSTSSPGTIISWAWDFGDGTSSTQQNPQHTYTANGTYITCLTIFTSDSCTSTFCDSIPISCISQPTCQAAFQYTLGQCPTVAFFDGSTASPGTIVSWAWDFGDGTSSTQQNPQHTYTANGTYVTCLTIFTSDSCTSTFCDSIPISCISQPTCQAAFQYTLGQCPTVAFFDGSTASPGTIVSWAWDFGDGTSSTQQNPQHTYTANGNYVTCLTIYTSDSCSSTFCDTIAITCISSPSCQAFFQYTLAQCPNVLFFDGSTAAPGDSIMGWFWDFGDGTTSTLPNPQHMYTANGNYLVCLTVFTVGACTDTYCDTIPINCISQPTCQASFQYTLAQCPTVQFVDGSTASPGTIVSWAWDFGDGTSSTLQNPQHTYTANGNYVTCLTIITSDSCTSTFCDTIPITCITPPSCQAFFQYTLAQCPNVLFFDGSTAGPGDAVISWFWDFGDGTTSTLQNPQHMYTANGTYVACLTIMTQNQCTDTYCDTIPINCINPSSCQAAFQVDMTNCPTVAFSDMSTATPGPIMSWAWDFGDGTSSATQNPTHTYTANGTYVVCLSIQTADSCFSTACDTIQISCITPPGCQAAFQVDGSNDPTFAFTDMSTANPGTIVSWAWDFGDGNASSMQNPTHTYGQNGFYVVCLTIMTNDSCVDTSCDTVQVTGLNIGEGLAGVTLSVGPNPFEDVLRIGLELDHAALVRIRVMDLLGKEAAHIEDAELSAGSHMLNWKPTGISGGVYLLEVTVGEGRETMRIMFGR